MQLTSLVYGALALVIASSISPVHSIAPCSRDAARPRKEFRNLSTTERNRYFQALRALKAEMRSTSSGSISTYDLLVNIHITNANWVHGYANFFSWHRRYLREVERHLQRVMNNDVTIMIPYWQWTLDSQNPAASPIFSSNAFGGNGGCFSSGQLPNWRPRYPSSHCLSRSFDAGSRISTWDNAAVINGIVLTSTAYDDIREQIEGGGHASVHVQIGGDMSQMRSPNDPIFWSHHAFIDKIWDDWQKLNGWSNYWKYNGPNQDGTQANLSDQMRPWSHTVRQILWTENLGYCYQAYSSSSSNLVRRQADEVPSFITITPVDEILSNPANEKDFDLLHRLVPNSKQGEDDEEEDTMGGASDTKVAEVDETNLFKLRYAKAIPEDYLKRNNLNVGRIRQYEAKKRHWCDKLNAQDDYVSSSAIINQPHLLRALAKNPKIKKLYGVIRGDYIEVDVSKVKNDSTKADQVYKQVSGTVKNKYGGYMKTNIDLYKLFTSN